MSPKIISRKVSAIAFAIGIATAGSLPLHAITFQITSDHATGGLGTAPFGTVELVAVGANVNFTVTPASGYQFVQTGAADDLYFKFNGIGIVAGDIVNEAGATGLQGFAGAFNGDGTGTFGFGVGVPNVSGNEPSGLNTILTFTVLNATIAELTVPNSLGNIFVADLLAPNGNTGPADVSTPGTAVPDGGSTIALLGGALMLLAGFARRGFSIA